MNINMIDGSEKSNAYVEKTKYSNPSSHDARIAESMVGYSLDITGKVMENAAYGKDELKSAESIAAEAGMVDVSKQRNYMAVMSNSMSEEDFSELLKEGYNPTHTEIEESVTSLDKLKAKMVESGQIIEGFNDDLSSEDIKEALNLGAAIMPLTDDNKAFLIRNNQEPTIENLYKAEFSGVGSTYSSYGINIQKADIAWDEIKPQAEKIINEAGLLPDNETLADAKWLIENQIPLNQENLKACKDLERISLPATSDMLMDAVKVALEEGKNAKDANLLHTKSLYIQAAEIKTEFDNLSDNGDITRRRQLEEVRLAMTVEANLTLLRKGITIDTSDLENLVDELKKAEEEFYKPLLGNTKEYSQNIETKENTADGEGIINSLREKIDLYKETQNSVENIKSLPIKAVGDIIEKRSDFTLSAIEKTGISLKADFEKAERSYESLMTAPRADMGDSISKAFRNVDDILNDLEMPLTDANRRAVRIMGYSQIQITKESVNEIREASQTLQSVINLMTPAKTLQMIREGHNPLTENLYELEKELNAESTEEKIEKYSEFLVRLERRGEISDEERSAFIGMYRLFDKIERKDSRVIGKVLVSGEELTLKNLLTAYRSGRFGHLNIEIDDEFGALNSIIEKGDSITDQIEYGFREMTKSETPREYISDKLSMIHEAAQEAEAVSILEEIELPVNVENILAASDLYKKGRSPFAKLTANASESEDTKEARKIIRESAKSLIKEFAEAEGDGQASYNKFVEDGLHESERMMEASQSYTDVKEWARLNRQIKIAGNMARADEYEIPMETDDGFISVHLKIKDTGNGEGRVEASYNDLVYGEIKAAFSVNEKTVTGIVSARYEGGFDLIKNKENEFRNALGKSGFDIGGFTYIKANSQNDTALAKGNSTNRDLFRVAGIFLMALEKE